MKYLIIILGIMVFCELKFDLFTKNLKKIFKLKNKDKIIVFITLTFIILFVSSFGGYQIAKYFQFKPFKNSGSLQSPLLKRISSRNYK